MARKIIVLDQSGLPSDSNYNVAFWLAVPVARQPFYANAAATSVVIGAQAAEITAIQQGQVVETVQSVSYPAGTTLAAITADLVSRYTAAQDALTTNNPWNRYGSSWNGTSWTPVTVA